VLNYNYETAKLKDEIPLLDGENYSRLLGYTWIQVRTVKRKENAAAGWDAGEKEHPSTK
jgi:hypothetical protein